jgi:chaperonin GroES
MATATKTKKKASSTRIKIQPLGDRVVIRRDESEDRTSGGIVLPDSAQDKPARGRVISVGDGRLLDDGTRSQLQVKAGDRVLFSSYAGEAITIGDEEFLLMQEENILAVFD